MPKYRVKASASDVVPQRMDTHPLSSRVGALLNLSMLLLCFPVSRGVDVIVEGEGHDEDI